ncbi:hypothetical protein JCM17846_00720 [Iodidimonas nitroreducens]|uniref:AB hydrolase-1 domain-containing protein n=1 Tax=Iodidimonas nitroreducens TaxID=1236968 RepID=A0A5A7N4T5_9PROT|nr:alpha/beta fold hydrolase [Iodidimonas nitroreducens]GER02390.1 hypothetical protein JCM17846_00720 [Iodidimonas nitroreducens]
MSNRLTSPKAWRASGHMASLRGHDIFYVDSADDDLAGLDGGRDDRPVVLVIHGFPTAGWDFHRVWPLLVPHMRLIIPDMLGFGFSAKPCPHRYGIFEQADLLEA